MFSLLLLLLALFTGSVIQIITKAPANEWIKVLKKMLMSAGETAILLGIMQILLLLDNQNRYSVALISVQNVFLYYGIWIAFVSFECRQFLFPKLTESGLFLLHCISLLTILPFIPLLLQNAPLLVLGIAIVTVFLFWNCITNRLLTYWEKLGLSVWYLIIILFNIAIRFLPYLGTAPQQWSFAVTDWTSFIDWILNAGLLTHILFHFFQLSALLPNKNTSWSGVRQQAQFLVSKVSNMQANRSLILLELVVIVTLYTLNHYLNLVSPTTLTAFLFLAIPVFDSTSQATKL